MNLPQFVHLFGNPFSCAALATRLESPTRIGINLDEAPEEFRQQFAPNLDLSKTIDLLYAFNKECLGYAGLRLFRAHTQSDPDAEAVVYPIRRSSDMVPFLREPYLAHAQHLLIKIGGGLIDIPHGSIRVLSIPNFADPDAGHAALQAEFAQSLRAVENPT